MAANLTPQYQRAEEQYRHALTSTERLACLERMLILIPKHKGTEKLQADLKTRLKTTRLEILAEKSAPRGGKAFRFARQGAAQVVIVGGPNAGKSLILKRLTKAEPEVAEYPFTTREPLPGIMEWLDVRMQLIDTPAITEQPFEPWLINLVRTADLVMLAFNGASDNAPQETAIVHDQLSCRHTRLDRVTKFNEEDFSIQHVRTLLCVTRGQDPGVDRRLKTWQELSQEDLPSVQVELDDESSIPLLKAAIWQQLDLLRVFTKTPGQTANRSEPLTLQRGATVEHLALQLHAELAQRLRFARIWNSNGTGPVQVGRDAILNDQDLVEIHA